MSAFSAEWLALREPADQAARCVPLTEAVASRLARDRELHVLDLAAGTGANVRYLVDRLPPEQSWLLVDHDHRLIDAVPACMRAWAATRGYRSAEEADGVRVEGEALSCRILTSCVDLAGLEDARVFAGRALITSSALLDLVSESWLEVLARRCRESGAAVLFALTYDGRVRCAPEEPEDEMIRELVNRHQRIDKGFGAALGPDAAASAVRIFSSFDYNVRVEPSDWVVPPKDRALQRRLIEGWADAAIAIAPDRIGAIENWRTRRVSHVDVDRSRLTVGHQDMGAWLGDWLGARG